jgi:pentatricopeptide repeat protein
VLTIQGEHRHSSSTNEVPGTIEIPIEKLPEERRSHIPKLNQAIQDFALQPSNYTNVQFLWKRYHRCRAYLILARDVVPPAAWKLLWEAFSTPRPENKNRMAHVKQLAEDMKAAGVKLDRPQTLLYLKALFYEGDYRKALSLWEAEQIFLSCYPSTASKYWELGVRMLANDNQPERAQEATDVLINGTGENDPRVLISIIRSWLKSPDRAAIQRAWATYIRLKYLLASKMKMKDYDDITGIFLEAEQTGLALAVFRDMMISDDPKLCEWNSVAIYRRTLNLHGDLESFKLAPAEMAWKSSDPFTALPREKRHKYFYGSWIKKLIGNGQIDWAAQVANWTYRRNLIPDPKYMNGIIGAWLRSGTAINNQKAEDLAWKLIAARLEFVRRRDKFGLQSPLQEDLSFESRAFIRPSKFAKVSTVATIETFCILLNFYQSRRRRDRAMELYKSIKAAKLKPNTAFLNDFILIGANLNRKDWTWDMYNQLVREDDVAPDHDTFTVLWQMMANHVRRPKSGFPMPRILFAEMVRWPQNRKQGALSQEAFELVISCFLNADDQIGTAVALRAMQHLFDLYPNEETITNIILQLAQTGHHKVFLPRRQDREGDLKTRISKITEAVNQFKQQRAKELLEKGLEFENMDATTRSEEVIMLLSKLLLVASRSTVVHPHNFEVSDGQVKMSSVQELVQVAAKEMGVPQCEPVAFSAAVM